MYTNVKAKQDTIISLSELSTGPITTTKRQNQDCSCPVPPPIGQLDNDVEDISRYINEKFAQNKESPKATEGFAFKPRKALLKKTGGFGLPFTGGDFDKTQTYDGHKCHCLVCQKQQQH